MATRQPTFTRPEGDDSVVLVTWTGLLNGDDGAPVQLIKYADRSVQIVGVFGTGGTVAIEGSNNGTDYATLNSVTGTALTVTTAGVRQILENTVLLRPRVTAGDGTTTLTVTALIRTGTAIIRR